jgi:hypothetical protein
MSTARASNIKRLIGTLGEKSLHAALKAWYSKPGDGLEERVDGFDIDIVRDDLLIEIQTKNFSSQRRKLRTLAEKHPVRLVFPIAREKWIIRVTTGGRIVRRLSPKRGHLYLLFEELVSIPSLLREDNFSLEVVFTREEEIRRNDGRGSWRRKGWSIADRRLVEVMSRHVFLRPSDFLALVPKDLPEPFSTLELSECIGQPRWLAQKIAYCLREMGAIQATGKNGNAILYSMGRA